MLGMTEELPEHLRVHTTGRGFDHLPEIPATYGGTVKTYESSAAMEPCLWIKIFEPDNMEPSKPPAEAYAHLTVDNAVKLAEQILYLAKHHYQLAEEE